MAAFGCAQAVGSHLRGSALDWLGIVALVSAVGVFGGCGDDSSSNGVDTTPPAVVITAPADGAVNIPPYPVPLVQVQFSEAMDPATIDTLNFHIDGLLSDSIAYDSGEHTASLWPPSTIRSATQYTVHVEPGVTDLAGNAMQGQFVFHFTTGGVDCAGLADQFEPNDNSGSAAQVTIGETYHGLTSCGAAERWDWYSFTVTEPSMITVSTPAVYLDTSRVHWNINFTTEDGHYYATLGTSLYSPQEHVESFHFTFMPGTYKVQVGKSYADPHLAVYDLEIVASAPAEDDEYEDNDFPDQATPLSPGLYEGLKGAYLDFDYFAFTLRAGQTITATVTEVTTIGTLRRVEITSAGGYPFTGDTNYDNPAVVSWMASENTTYLVMVGWWADGVVYNLDVAVTD